LTGSTTSAAGAGAGTLLSATATCPAGKVLLGGGALVTNTQAAQRVVLTGSRPTSTTVWTATAVVITGLTGVNTATVTAYAICTA
jgi:hypothetical protein